MVVAVGGECPWINFCCCQRRQSGRAAERQSGGGAEGSGVPCDHPRPETWRGGRKVSGVPCLPCPNSCFLAVFVILVPVFGTSKNGENRGNRIVFGMLELCTCQCLAVWAVRWHSRSHAALWNPQCGGRECASREHGDLETWDYGVLKVLCMKWTGPPTNRRLLIGVRSAARMGSALFRGKPYVPR